MAERELNYRVGLETEQLRSQLMALQGDVSNLVNQSSAAVQTGMSTPAHVRQQMASARAQQQAATYRASNAVPTGSTASMRQKATINRASGGYQYDPTFTQAMWGSMGLSSPPTGIDQQQWQDTNKEIASNQIGGGLAKAGGLGTFGLAAGLSFSPLQSVGSAVASPAANAATSGATRVGLGLARSGLQAGAKVIGGGVGRMLGMSSLGSSLSSGIGSLMSSGTMGTVASGAGSLAGVAAGFALPIAGSMVAMEGFDTAMESVNNYRGFRQLMDQTSYRYMPSNISSAKGQEAGFGSKQLDDVADFLHGQWENNDMKASNIQDIVMTGTRTGMFNDVNNVDDFKEQFKELTSKVKKVSEVLHQSLDEGLSTISELERMGYTNTRGMMSAARSIETNANLAGKTNDEMLRTFNQGGAMGRKMGIGSKAGAKLHSNISSSIHNLYKRGEYTMAEMSRFGGASGLAKRMTQSVTSSFTKSKVGQAMLGAMANEDFSGIDEETYRQVMTDGADFKSLVREKFPDGNWREAMMKFRNNKDDIMSDLLKQDQAHRLPLRIAQSHLKSIDAEVNSSNVEGYLRNNLGYSNKMVDKYMDFATDTSLLDQRRKAKTEGVRERLENKMQEQYRSGGLMSPLWQTVDATEQAGTAIASGAKTAYTEALEPAGEKIVNELKEMKNVLLGKDPRVGKHDIPTINADYMKNNPRESLQNMQRTMGMIQDVSGNKSIFERDLPGDTSSAMGKSIGGYAEWSQALMHSFAEFNENLTGKDEDFSKRIARQHSNTIVNNSSGMEKIRGQISMGKPKGYMNALGRFFNDSQMEQIQGLVKNEGRTLAGAAKNVAPNKVELIRGLSGEAEFGKRGVTRALQKVETGQYESPSKKMKALGQEYGKNVDFKDDSAWYQWGNRKKDTSFIPSQLNQMAEDATGQEADSFFDRPEKVRNLVIRSLRKYGGVDQNDPNRTFGKIEDIVSGDYSQIDNMKDIMGRYKDIEGRFEDVASELGLDDDIVKRITTDKDLRKVLGRMRGTMLSDGSPLDKLVNLQNKSKSELKNIIDKRGLDINKDQKEKALRESVRKKADTNMGDLAKKYADRYGVDVSGMADIIRFYNKLDQSGMSTDSKTQKKSDALVSELVAKGEAAQPLKNAAPTIRAIEDFNKSLDSPLKMNKDILDKYMKESTGSAHDKFKEEYPALYKLAKPFKGKDNFRAGMSERLKDLKKVAEKRDDISKKEVAQLGNMAYKTAEALPNTDISAGNVLGQLIKLKQAIDSEQKKKDKHTEFTSEAGGALGDMVEKAQLQLDKFNQINKGLEDLADAVSGITPQ